MTFNKCNLIRIQQQMTYSQPKSTSDISAKLAFLMLVVL